MIKLTTLYGHDLRDVLQLCDADEEGQFLDRDLWLPGRYEVCGRCCGKGTHVNPSIDGHGISREEMDELGPDFYEDYMSGVYDIRCQGCDGNRVTPVIDPEAMENAEPWQKRLLELCDEVAQDDADYAAEVAAERRMGA